MINAGLIGCRKIFAPAPQAAPNGDLHHTLDGDARIYWLAGKVTF
jgi:hypothetical protein